MNKEDFLFSKRVIQIDSRCFMTNCKLCENVQVYKELTKGVFKGWYYPQRNENSIVYDNQDKVFDIWSDGGGDIFMAGVCIDDIKYCPKCGRELRKVDINL